MSCIPLNLHNVFVVSSAFIVRCYLDRLYSEISPLHLDSNKDFNKSHAALNLVMSILVCVETILFLFIVVSIMTFIGITTQNKSRPF